ncbi:hypothetical protein ACFV9C_21595 [Kribbella sp. NPDC059898]|uniref:hypothetical protein n=1 Tax=Kribbella sp. NPDC059898 TaxID=3346995 RepID=UPI003664FC2D
MATNQVLALTLIFGLSFAIAKHWRKVLVFLGAVAMTVAGFGVYSIVETVRGADIVHSDVDPAGVQAGATAAPTAQSTAQHGR